MHETKHVSIRVCVFDLEVGHHSLLSCVTPKSKGRPLTRQDRGNKGVDGKRDRGPFRGSHLGGLVGFKCLRTSLVRISTSLETEEGEKKRRGGCMGRLRCT